MVELQEKKNGFTLKVLGCLPGRGKKRAQAQGFAGLLQGVLNYVPANTEAQQTDPYLAPLHDVIAQALFERKKDYSRYQAMLHSAC